MMRVDAQPPFWRRCGGWVAGEIVGCSIDVAVMIRYSVPGHGLGAGQRETGFGAEHAERGIR